MKAWQVIKAHFARTVAEVHGKKADPRDYRASINLFAGSGPRKYRRNLIPARVRLAKHNTLNRQFMHKFTSRWRTTPA